LVVGAGRTEEPSGAAVSILILRSPTSGARSLRFIQVIKGTTIMTFRVTGSSGGRTVASG
jgi:hypothetical protein